MKRRTILATLCLCVLTAAASGAAPLADRLPAKTLAYVGWAGKTKAFDRSMLGQLTREPVADAIVKAIKQAAEKNIRGKEERQAFQDVWELLSVTWKHPIAVALVDLKLAQDGPPNVSAALLIDLGQDRAKFAKHLDALLALAKKDVPTADAELPGGLKYRRLLIKDKDAPPVSLGYMGNVFFLCLGAETPAALAGVKGDASLQSSADFKAQFGQVDGDDVLQAVYVDVAAILKRVEPMMGPPAGEGRGPTPKKIMKALGVAKIQALAGSVRVADRGLHSKLKLFTPAPHQGILMLFAGGKLTDADLASVPADATFFGAAKISPQKVFDEIRRIIRIVDPAEEEDFLEGIKSIEDGLGVSVTGDILPSVGDTWVLSSAPSQGGFLTGTVLTLELKDTKKFSRVLAKVEDVMRKQMTPPEPAPDAPAPGDAPAPRRRRGPAIESVTIDGVAIRYVRLAGMPVPVAPAWAVHKGKLYVAAWPQVVATAIANEGKKPLTRDPAFRALRKRIARGPSMLGYVNMPQIVRQFYNLGLVGWTLAANMLSQKADIDVKPDWLPLLSKLEKYLSPGICAVSAEIDGITFESYSSLPSPALAAPLAAAALYVFLRPEPGEPATATLDSIETRRGPGRLKDAKSGPPPAKPPREDF